LSGGIDVFFVNSLRCGICCQIIRDSKESLESTINVRTTGNSRLSWQLSTVSSIGKSMTVITVIPVRLKNIYALAVTVTVRAAKTTAFSTYKLNLTHIYEISRKKKKLDLGLLISVVEL